MVKSVWISAFVSSVNVSWLSWSKLSFSRNSIGTVDFYCKDFFYKAPLTEFFFYGTKAPTLFFQITTIINYYFRLLARWQRRSRGVLSEFWPRSDRWPRWWESFARPTKQWLSRWSVEVVKWSTLELHQLGLWPAGKRGLRRLRYDAHHRRAVGRLCLYD